MCEQAPGWRYMGRRMMLVWKKRMEGVRNAEVRVLLGRREEKMCPFVDFMCRGRGIEGKGSGRRRVQDESWFQGRWQRTKRPLARPFPLRRGDRSQQGDTL